MTQKEILEYNKRCAEFLTIHEYEEHSNELEAYPQQQYSPLCSYANAAYSFDKEDNPQNTVWDYVKFHSDWNWIMEVVEAIEKLKYEVHIFAHYNWKEPNRCIIHDWKNNEIVQIANQSKKEAVVEAIDQFLIWYKLKNI